MMPEKIHDALSLLDDDLVESVNALRLRRRPKRINWAQWSRTLAACLCIVLAGALVWRLFGGWRTGSSPGSGASSGASASSGSGSSSSSDSSSPAGDSASGGSAMGGAAADSALQFGAESPGSSDFSSAVNEDELEGGVVMEGSQHEPDPDSGSSSAAHMEVIYVRIDSWLPDGFTGVIVTGTVLDGEKGVAFAEGEQVTVRWGEDTTIVQPDGSLFQYDGAMRAAEDSGLPAGSVVHVGFQSYDHTAEGDPSNVVYAYHIEPEEDSPPAG